MSKKEMAMTASFQDKTREEQIADFERTLKEADDKKLSELANQYIWLSAYASNNPRSIYHNYCDMVYKECANRGKESIYEREWQKLWKEARGY